MKHWICYAFLATLPACSMVKTQEMVNAEGRRFECPSSGYGNLAANPLALKETLQNRELCIETNRQRGWLPVQEVGAVPLRFQERDGKVFVAEVLPGFPSRNNVTRQDMLMAVDDVPVVSLQDAQERLFGKFGTPVRLTLTGPQGELTMQLVRQ